MQPEKTTKFLEELTALTIKHGIKIAGCGCCDSPYLVEQLLPGKYELRGEQLVYTLGPAIQWAEDVHKQVIHEDCLRYLDCLNGIPMVSRETLEEKLEGVVLTKLFVSKRTLRTYPPCPQT